MTVVKFSILTLLAGGFCTLLGIGMWMGPQEAPCNAQTGAAVVEQPARQTSQRAEVDACIPVERCDDRYPQAGQIDEHPPSFHGCPGARQRVSNCGVAARVRRRR